MALDVVVNIRLIKPAGKEGMWYPLLYLIQGEGEEEMYKEYASLEDVLEDFEVDTDAYKIANLIFMQDDPPENLAICRGSGTDKVTALKNHIKKNWRQVVVAGEFDADLAAYIETTDKMYFTHFADQASLKAVEATIGEYDRTFAVVYDSPVDKEGNKVVTYPEAAIVGATAGLKAGSCTYKNMIIKGVPAMEYSDAEIKAIHDVNGNTIVEKVGDIVTSEGIVASGEYADIIDSKDYIIQNITYRVQKVFNNNKKVPYTNSGIAMLEAATLEALKDGYNNGMIADNDDGSPAWALNFRLRSQTTEHDRYARDYPYGKFSFVLAGAIHKATINGEITF